MGSVFILACCNTERQNQPHTVTRHTQQVVSNSVDILSNQFKPDAGDGGGVLLIPEDCVKKLPMLDQLSAAVTRTPTSNSARRIHF